MLPPRDNLAARHAQLRRVIAGLGVERLLVTSLPNVSWLTGFDGSSAAALVGPAAVVLVVDGRYVDEAGHIAAHADGLVRIATVAKTYDETIASLITAAPEPIGFEAGALTVWRHHWLGATLQAAQWPADRLIATSNAVEACRVVKDAWEIAVLREAGARLSAVAQGILADFRPGARETDLAQAIETGLRRAGFTRPAFDTIVASGPRAALPHGRASDRTIQPGEPVVLDFGGVYGGYCVDLTRTVCSGPAGSELQHWYDAVVAAQAAAIGAVRPGQAAGAIDREARQQLELRGLGERFTHGTGHGLGLEVHEAPRIGPPRPEPMHRPGAGVASMPDHLEPGMVFTVEPGVYVAGRGGVRIEDDVLVTSSGVDVLTSVPRTLVLD